MKPVEKLKLKLEPALSFAKRQLPWLRPVKYASMGGLVCFYSYSCFFEVMEFAGPSMQPTIASGELGLCRKVGSLPKDLDSLKKGDIVIAISHNDPDVRICKRIGAMSGELIGNVMAGEGSFFQIGDTRYGRRVPRGHVWLEGDNKMCSLDSRNYGPVPAGLITSVLRYKININDLSFKSM